MKKLFLLIICLLCLLRPALAKSVQDIAYINGIVDTYKVSDTDEPGSPQYYGFLNDEGDWYIMKEVVSGDTKTYTYVKGSGAYSTAWTNRAAQTYATFDNVF